MKTRFISKKYLALTLITFKNKILHENFITISELNQFDYLLQKEFNNRDLDIAIIDSLNIEEFNINKGVITINDCTLSLDSLPSDISNLLYDENFIIDFLIQLENEKIETLEKIKSNPKVLEKIK